MTAPKHTLVEQVAIAISQWMNCQKLPKPHMWLRLDTATQTAYREQAQAALDACHAEELAATLREYVDAADQCASSDDDVVAMLRFGAADKNARALLAKLGVRP